MPLRSFSTTSCRREGQAVLATQSAPALAGVDGFINFEDVDPLVAPFAEFEAYVEKWNGIFGR